MSRFLFTVWLSETHLSPQLAVASLLRAAGHQVAFYAGPSLAGSIQELGFTVFPFERLSEEVADRYMAPMAADHGGWRKRVAYLLGLFVSQIPEQVEDLTHVLDSWSPDVLISDMTMLAPFVILQELRKVRVAVLSHVGYCLFPGVEGPIPGRAMAPRGSAMSRLRAGLLLRASKFFTRKFPEALDRMRERYGLAATGLRITDYHASVPLLMIPTVPELDYSRSDLPQNVRYVGNCAWPPIENSSSPNQGRPRILLEEGKLHSAEPTFLKRGTEALAGSNFDVLVVAGSQRCKVSGLGFPSQNIQTRPLIPLSESLSGVSLLVTNGNTESVLSALALGIPVITMPEIQDQTEMGLRVQTAGAGMVMSTRASTSGKLLQSVLTVLNEVKYREKAAEAASWLARYQGPAEAVRLLEGLAEPVWSS